MTVDEQVIPPAPEADALKSQLKELKQKKSEQETRIKANTAFIDFWMTRAKTRRRPRKMPNPPKIWAMP
ncbi:MAG: hypothetical protein R2860_16210 [Desulfobacterales bacterium]